MRSYVIELIVKQFLNSLTVSCQKMPFAAISLAYFLRLIRNNKLITNLRTSLTHKLTHWTDSTRPWEFASHGLF